MALPTAGIQPKHLRASYLAPQEMLLRETRATKLYFFPGPIVALLIVAFLDYSAWSARDPGSGPSVPWITHALSTLPTVSGTPVVDYVFDLLLLLTVIVLLLLLVRYLRWITTVYAVTTSRVIIQRGIVSRDFLEIPVDQVRGVDVHQTPGERILGYGTITISSEGGKTVGNEAWKGIPKPFQFQRLVEGASQNIRSGPPTAASVSTMLRPPGST